MICTEQTAHDLWCPMAGAQDGVISTRSMTAQTGNCIGSACMFWEWVDPDTFQNLAGKYEAVPRSEIRGTCGLINRSAP